MRAIVHYIAAIALLTIYGGQVCPLLDTLTLAQWGLILCATFIPLVIARHLLLPRVVTSAPLYDQPARQFFLELGLFTAFGISLAVYNALVLDFSFIESGPKVIIGFILFGFFIGLDLALARERKNGEEIIRLNLTPPETTRYTSLTRKFSAFALATVVLAGTVLILTVVKDVYWLTAVDFAMDGHMAQLLIVIEIAFILILLSAYVLTIIIGYTRNIRLFFGNETHVLRKVRDGDLTNRVPALSRDEFGEIASYTNIMIDGLRERDRIKNMFGKAVSPTIATRLMEQEEKGVSLGGSMQPLVILFSDIRSFTSRTEASSPQTVIADLNAWFTQAVEAITDHDGVVDKFIGDGILAVFGLDGDMAACEKAVACAKEMLRRLDALNPSLSAPMGIGIGIHKGDVLAGIVGSSERLEFTVIGDVVNTASRIEGMTRVLDTSILISETVRNDLKETEGLKDYGERELKGKSVKMRLFGLSDTSDASISRTQ